MANGSGTSDRATSGATGVVPASAPAAGAAPTNQGAPSITGAAIVGERLAEAHGLWTSSPTSYVYQWLRCPANGSSCTAITNSASSTYVVSSSDVGFAIRVQESAANAFGTSSPAVSSATSVVPSPPPPRLSVTILSIAGPTVVVRVTCQGQDGEMCLGQLTLTSQERTHGRTVVAVTARHGGQLTRVALGHTSFAVPAPGHARVSIRIDAAGRRLLGEFYKLPARLTFPGTALPARTVTFDYPVIGDVIRYTASWGLRFTTMPGFSATGVPAHASVQLRCHGPGCPFHHHTSHPTGADVDLTSLFGDAHLLPTATVYAAVTARNMVGEVLLMRIRAGAPPRVTKLCLVPGVRAARPCRRADSGGDLAPGVDGPSPQGRPVSGPVVNMDRAEQELVIGSSPKATVLLRAKG